MDKHEKAAIAMAEKDVPLGLFHRGPCQGCGKTGILHEVRVVRIRGIMTKRLWIETQYLCRRCGMKEKVFVDGKGIIRENVVIKTDECSMLETP